MKEREKQIETKGEREGNRKKIVNIDKWQWNLEKNIKGRKLRKRIDRKERDIYVKRDGDNNILIKTFLRNT